MANASFQTILYVSKCVGGVVRHRGGSLPQQALLIAEAPADRQTIHPRITGGEDVHLGIPYKEGFFCRYTQLLQCPQSAVGGGLGGAVGDVARRHRNGISEIKEVK